MVKEIIALAKKGETLNFRAVAQVLRDRAEHVGWFPS